jgi:hypothetical protein
MTRAVQSAAVIADALQEAGYEARPSRGGNTVVVSAGRSMVRARFTVQSDGSVVIEHEEEPWEVEHLLKAARLGSSVKIRGKLYDVHGLDVWGNEEDGFEVNDVYPSRGTIEIPLHAKTADIVKALKEDGYIDRDVSPSNIEIDGDEYNLDVRDASNGQPVYQLRPA